MCITANEVSAVSVHRESGHRGPSVNGTSVRSLRARRTSRSQHNGTKRRASNPLERSWGGRNSSAFSCRATPNARRGAVSATTSVRSTVTEEEASPKTDHRRHHVSRMSSQARSEPTSGVRKARRYGLAALLASPKDPKQRSRESIGGVDQTLRLARSPITPALKRSPPSVGAAPLGMAERGSGVLLAAVRVERVHEKSRGGASVFRQ